MPTYDAVHIKYLLDGYAERARRREELNRILDERDMSGLECTETVQLEKLMARDFVDMPDMRDQLLAATQEVERLTRENERLDNVAKALAGSHARLREENEALSPLRSLLDDWRWSEMDWHDIRDSDLAQRIVDAFATAERAFAAIRHAAGVGEEG